MSDREQSSNQYHFEDSWRIPFPIEDVWEVLSRPTEFPIWWHGVYLSAEPLDGDDIPRVGARIAAVARGWLPYRLRFVIETTKLARPYLIEFKATGDFRTDASRWILRPETTGTTVILDWNPIVEKPIVKLLSPILKPLFEWNHRWTMTRGEKQIVAYLEQRAKVARRQQGYR